jgi:hypothetical protein
MSNVILGGPYPKCPVCGIGNLVPIHIGEDGHIMWKCTNPKCQNSLW